MTYHRCEEIKIAVTRQGAVNARLNFERLAEISTSDCKTEHTCTASNNIVNNHTAAF